MTVVAQPTHNYHSSLVIDDRIARGMGSSANELLERLCISTQGYYGLSEALLNYPPFTHFTLAIIDTNLFERFTKKALGDTLGEIYSMLTWDVGWNGYNAPKPEHSAVVRAGQWITDLFREVADLGWMKPNVTGGPDGGVVFEWWSGERKLTIYVGEQSIEYVQVWGTDVNSEISGGDIESINDCRSLWMWLINR